MIAMHAKRPTTGDVERLMDRVDRLEGAQSQVSLQLQKLWELHDRVERLEAKRASEMAIQNAWLKTISNRLVWIFLVIVLFAVIILGVMGR